MILGSVSRRLLVPALFIAAGAGASEPVDPRSVVLLREECRSPISRLELTLFANGTLRLREGVPGSEALNLHELGHQETAAFVRRLDEIDLAETEREMRAPGGEWIESCRLDLTLRERMPVTLRYDRYASGSLAFGRLRGVVRDLLQEARRHLGSAEIPANYSPQVGDRLQRADGALFEIRSFTLEGMGIELVGLDQPLTLYVERKRIREVFLRLVPSPSGR